MHGKLTVSSEKCKQLSGSAYSPVQQRTDFTKLTDVLNLISTLNMENMYTHRAGWLDSLSLKRREEKRREEKRGTGGSVMHFMGTEGRK